MNRLYSFSRGGNGWCRWLVGSLFCVVIAACEWSTMEPQQRALPRADCRGFADRSAGVVTLTFGNGGDYVYNRAYPILQKYGIRANVSVVSSLIDKPGYLTMDQLYELHEAGWSVISQSHTNRLLVELSDAALEAELAQSRAWIDDRGFCGGQMFIVPFHSWNDREKKAVKRHFSAARGVATTSDLSPGIPSWPLEDPYAISSFPANSAPFTTVIGRNAIRRHLTDGVRQKKLVAVYMGMIEQGEVGDFEKMVQIFAEFESRTFPYHQLVR